LWNFISFFWRWNKVEDLLFVYYEIETLKHLFKKDFVILDLKAYSKINSIYVVLRKKKILNLIILF